METTSTRAPELGLAAVVLGVVTLMIVPLPTVALDLLLTANIAVAVVLLLTALDVRSGLELSSFPTLLLVTTLARLALNIASTRLVLLQADAGEVIEAFGHFVVRGNYVVGGVVFALLTLIQFLVIAKGSERVAEVGARFTLDAMPGKQMAIDAELRSGGIDGATARRRRAELSRESQFYGAMDGAMKFVKGDAIAGLVITAVNLLGGLVVGVLQRDLALGDAARTYSLLTIGDGLVSQIPALLLSTSAGLVVTRVASASGDVALGAEVAEQVLGRPGPLRLAAAFLALLGLVPGLPALPFFVLAGVAATAAHRAAAARATPTGARTLLGDASDVFVPRIEPLVVTLPEPPTDPASRALEAALEGARSQLFRDLGVLLPSAAIRVEAADDGAATVSLLEGAGARVDPTPEAIADAVVAAATRRAEDLVGLQETQELLDRLERVAPAAVRNVVPKPVALPTLAEVLRRLVAEGVSVRPLREILECLAQHAATERDPAELAELARMATRRTWVRGLAPDERLHALLLDPSVEDIVRDAIRRTPSGSFLALPPAAAADLLDAIRSHVTETGCPVLLTQSDVRRFVRKLVQHELPALRVLAYGELPSDVAVTPVARIEV